MENLHRLQTECSYGANLPIPTKQIQNNAKSTQDKTNKAPEEHPVCRANTHKNKKLRRSILFVEPTHTKTRYSGGATYCKSTQNQNIDVKQYTNLLIYLSRTYTLYITAKKEILSCTSKDITE